MLGDRLIMISGIDGSGKSSHLSWIAAALRADGQPYRYVRMRWSAFTSYPLLGVARMMGYAPREYNKRSQSVVIKHRYDESAMMHKLWPMLFAFDTAINASKKVIRPLERGEWVLCDRYVVDAIVDVAAMLKDENLLRGKFADKLLSLVPQGTRKLFLDTDPMVAFERKLDIPEPEFVLYRRPLYGRLSALTQTPVIDGNRSYEKIQEDIARIVGFGPLAEHRGVIPEGIA